MFDMAIVINYTHAYVGTGSMSLCYPLELVSIRCTELFQGEVMQNTKVSLSWKEQRSQIIDAQYVNLLIMVLV